MKSANPYLNFPGNTEEVFEFYRSVFGGEFSSLMRFSDFADDPMGVPENERDKIAHIGLPLGGGSLLMATDTLEGWDPPVPGSNFYVALEPESIEETDRVFAALSAGGKVEMEAQRTAWAEKYGTCIDRYGIRWMLVYTGDVQFPDAAAGS